jgi:hypothetical protein
MLNVHAIYDMQNRKPCESGRHNEYIFTFFQHEIGTFLPEKENKIHNASYINITEEIPHKSHTVEIPHKYHTVEIPHKYHIAEISHWEYCLY